MQKSDADTRNIGGPSAADGGGAALEEPGKVRVWSVQEKIRVARESFSTSETVAAVARRHGISRYRLSSWRSLLRQGKLVARSSGRTGAEPGFAAVAVEEHSSAVIEGSGVTVRLHGRMEPSGTRHPVEVSPNRRSEARAVACGPRPSAIPAPPASPRPASRRTLSTPACSWRGTSFR